MISNLSTFLNLILDHQWATLIGATFFNSVHGGGLGVGGVKRGEVLKTGLGLVHRGSDFTLDSAMDCMQHRPNK